MKIQTVEQCDKLVADALALYKNKTLRPTTGRIFREITEHEKERSPQTVCLACAAGAILYSITGVTEYFDQYDAFRKAIEVPKDDYEMICGIYNVFDGTLSDMRDNTDLKFIEDNLWDMNGTLKYESYARRSGGDNAFGMYMGLKIIEGLQELGREYYGII